MSHLFVHLQSHLSLHLSKVFTCSSTWLKDMPIMEEGQVSQIRSRIHGLTLLLQLAKVEKTIIQTPFFTVTMKTQNMLILLHSHHHATIIFRKLFLKSLLLNHYYRLRVNEWNHVSIFTPRWSHIGDDFVKSAWIQSRLEWNPLQSGGKLYSFAMDSTIVSRDCSLLQ